MNRFNYLPTYHLEEQSNVLDRSTGKDLEDYHLNGNSYQETRGKNLVDINNILNISPYFTSIVTENAIEITRISDVNTVNTTLYKINERFLADTKLTFSANNIYSTSENSTAVLKNTIRLRITYSDNTTGWFFIGNSISPFGSVITLPKDTTSIEVVLTNIGNCQWVQNETIVFDELQLEVGATKTEYEPYKNIPSPDNPSEVLSLGESSKNLFDGNLLKGYITDNVGTMAAIYSDTYRTIKIKLEPGTYTISTNAYIYIIRTAIDSVYTQLTGKSCYNYTFTAVTNSEVSISFRRVDNTTWNDTDTLQLEESNVKTDFKPYRYIDVLSSGKNILNSEWYRSSYTASGVTWVKNGDTLIANGTLTSALSSCPVTTISAQTQELANSLKPNHTYKLIGEPNLGITGLRTYVFAVVTRDGVNKYYSSDTNGTFTFLEGDSCIFALRIYSSDGVLRTINNAEFKPAILDITYDTNTNYEPYQAPIITTIDMTKSRNLFDKNTMNTRITAWINTSNQWTLSTDSYSIRIPCEPNKTYCISENNPNNTVFRAGYTTTESIPVSGTPIQLYSATRYNNDSVPIIITTGADAKYIVIQSSYSEAEISLQTLQVEYGTTPTEYVQYFSGKPLRQVEDISDYIDYKNKKIVRNIGEFVITGNESWVLNSNYTNEQIITITYNDLLKRFGTKSVIKSNYFSYYATSTKANVGRTSLNMYLFLSFDKTQFPNLQTTLAWLKEKYANGTPVIIYYQLKTPTEEPFESPTVTTLKKTCYITANDDLLESSNINCLYYKN